MSAGYFWSKRCFLGVIVVNFLRDFFMEDVELLSISNISFPGGGGEADGVGGGCRQCSQEEVLRVLPSGAVRCCNGTTDALLNEVTSISNIPSPADISGIDAGLKPENYQCRRLLWHLGVGGSLGDLPIGAVTCGNATIDALIVFDRALMPGPTCANVGHVFDGGDLQCVAYNSTTFAMMSTAAGSCPGSICGSSAECVKNDEIPAYVSKPDSGLCVWVRNETIQGVQKYSITPYIASNTTIQIGTFGNSSGFSNGSVCAKVSVYDGMATIDDSTNNHDCNVPGQICANATAVTNTGTNIFVPTKGNCVWYSTDNNTIMASVAPNTPCSYQPSLVEYITGYVLNNVDTHITICNGSVSEFSYTTTLNPIDALLDLQNAVQNLTGDIQTYSNCTKDLLGGGESVSVPFDQMMKNVAACCLQINASITGNGAFFYAECKKYFCDPISHLSTNTKEISDYWRTITC